MAELDFLKNPTSTAKRLHKILRSDLEDRLVTIDAYLRGWHPEPYMPDNADAEYKMLAGRATTNMMPLLVNAPSQILSVDGYRRGRHTVKAGSEESLKIGPRQALPEWEHWEQSRLQARQDAVHKSALAYGHSFTVTEKIDGKVMTKGLSPLRTSAIYEDPANDDNAVAALHIKVWPSGSDDKRKPGTALMWDRTFWYEYRFYDEDRWSIVDHGRHGGEGENPVTRFASFVDLEGRTMGVLEPFFAIQDRLNQTVFDLLVAQTGASFQVRWVTGMAPPIKMRYPLDADGEPDFAAEPVPELDADGQPIALPINIHAKKMMFAEDDGVQFGNFDATPLDPYLAAIEQAIKDLSSVSQTPPHYMMGQIANLSADAMKAAEATLTRKANNFKLVFGESWERVFRLALRLSGAPGDDDMTGEVIWRDLEAASISQAADAYGKMAEQLGIPKRGLWKLLPGVTQTMLSEWETLYEEEGELGTIQQDPGTLENSQEVNDDGDQSNEDEGGAGGR